jgi:HAD superfamily phosphatase
MTLPVSPFAIAVFDIDGVLRDVGNSYRRALADTVEHFTRGLYRPTSEQIDELKAEGRWNNDWEGSQELVYRYFEGQGQGRSTLDLPYDDIVAFFQRRYRGPNPEDPDQWTGYITQEPLLVGAEYFTGLSGDRVAWGFFSGATRGSAQFVLQRRLGLEQPTLIAMEDAPGKPDPTGLGLVVEALTGQGPLPADLPVIYSGDTVADMQTVVQARARYPHRRWLGVGVLPPHVLGAADRYRQAYRDTLAQAGADWICDRVTDLNAAAVADLLAP